MSELHRLKDDHRRLLALAGEAEALLADGPPSDHERLRTCLRGLIELLQAHGQVEEKELFPILRGRLPDADRWQIKMIEIQDEAIVTLARELAAWSVGGSPHPVEWAREQSARLFRWLCEHVTIEEERLFTRLEGGPGPVL